MVSPTNGGGAERPHGVATPARRAQLIEQLREQRQLLLVTIERLPQQETRHPLFTRGERRSTICDELSRLEHAEVNYAAWLERARSEREPDVTRDPYLRADIDEAHADRYPIEEIFETTRLVRRGTMALIPDLQPGDLLRRVKAPPGALSVDELIGALARHDRELAPAIAPRDGTRLPRFFAREGVAGAGALDG